MCILHLQSGLSPLIIATNKGHLEVVKLLLEAKVPVNYTEKVNLVRFCFNIYYNSMFCIVLCTSPKAGVRCSLQQSQAKWIW